MAVRKGITEQIKAQNRMLWVQRMNKRPESGYGGDRSSAFVGDAGVQVPSPLNLVH